MTVVSTLDIGPVSTTPYDFTAQVSAPSDVTGFSGVTCAGSMEIALAKTLEALSRNPTLRRTIKGVGGALAYVVAGSTAIDSITGYHLIQSFNWSPDGIDPGWPYASFSMQSVLIGDVA